MELDTKFPYRKDFLQVYYHPDCRLHEVGEGHPETTARLDAILKGCSRLPTHLPVSFRISPPARLDQLELVHDRGYLLLLESCCRRGRPYFMSPDNHIGPNTFRAALAAGGCALALAETLLDHGAGFALTRPPGHHAGKKAAEGFCFINHIALAIETIRKKEPTATFLVVDFDVHHGNGIDSLYDDDPKVFYYSLHGEPEHIYPNTGYKHDTGRGAGKGYTRNITLSLDSSGDDWLHQFKVNLFDFEEKIRPDYLLVGAGFDAHRDDPFGVMAVEDEHFLEAVRCLEKVATDHCSGRFGLFLEGGYSSEVLQRLVPKIIALLAEDRAASQELSIALPKEIPEATTRS
jgi:acetoin utilization deacetylase AcuC-like enzyme